MRRFILKSILFLSPFLLTLFIELFVLPIDHFAFRVWEALSVGEFRNILPGPFYPNQEITKAEKGDIGHHFDFAVKREARWVTDRYGYRKESTDVRKHSIVIVGDSNITGSGLTQEEILSEVLETKLKVSVYPYAPVRSINIFLRDRRFIGNAPETLIFASIERDLLRLSALKEPKQRKWASQLIEIMNRNQRIQNVIVLLDRLSKLNMLHFLRASLRRCFGSPSINLFAKAPSPYGQILFLQGAKANREVSKEMLDRTVGIILSYHNIVRTRGSRFIFMPIPEKENIFHELLGTRRPIFLEELITTLKEKGVETLDTQKAFEEAYRKNRVLLYQTEDAHWNAEGVRVAAELIEKAIRE